MKNILIITFTLLLIISITGCAHNPETIQTSPDNNPVLISKTDKAATETVGNNNVTPPSSISTNNNSGEQNNNSSNLTEPGGVVNIKNSNNEGTKYYPHSVQANVEEKPPQTNNNKNSVDYNGVPPVSSEITSLNNKKFENEMDEALDYCQMSQELWQKGELENAIEALDQAYSLILSIDPDDNSTLAQQKEDIRFTISKRILEIYASRNFAVNGNHKAIPMEMNSHIQAEIALFTTGIERNFFRESLKRSGSFRPQILEKLKQAGLPEELSWVPLIESGFKVNALSSARALGLWQFIPSTGYKFGLKRDLFVDERLDPVKSTEAAIAYLKELHQMFGDWTTVLAAYNCGEGRVLRIIRDQNINYLDNFWDLYGRLPRETARYVPRFLATLHVLSNPEKYGLDKVDLALPWEYETVSITKQAHLKDIAKELCIDADDLKQINPELRYDILPPYTYLLKAPPGKTEELLAKIDSIPVSTARQHVSSDYQNHRIKRGETLSVISKRYRVSVQSLMRANNMRKPILIAGKMLKIPGYQGSSSKTESTTQQAKYTPQKKELPSTHIVKSGESLLIIANRYNTTVKNIQELNNLNTINLHIGQVLFVQKQSGYNETNAVKKKCRVKSGDNLFRISQNHNMPLERLLRINKLTPKSKIHAGQYIYVE
ncbi:MAG: LysM peptidoglycan-binding domain-containing protein [Proteobacteria bacterium]|nr:LysM peptidoglycan-binding domain-containing protein [Pseudomonadota bacterium]